MVQLTLLLLTGNLLNIQSCKSRLLLSNKVSSLKKHCLSFCNNVISDHNWSHKFGPSIQIKLLLVYLDIFRPISTIFLQFFFLVHKRILWGSEWVISLSFRTFFLYSCADYFVRDWTLLNTTDNAEVCNEFNNKTEKSTKLLEKKSANSGKSLSKWTRRNTLIQGKNCPPNLPCGLE